MLLSNRDSFLLARKSNPDTVLPSNKKNTETNKIFLPNEYSFLLSKKSIIDSAFVSNGKNTETNKIFLPNRYSFLLSTKSINNPALASNEENVSVVNIEQIGEEEISVSNKSRRNFLKMAGVAGVGIIASQLAPEKAEAFIMGSSPTTGIVGVKDSSNLRIDPATEATVSSLLKTSDLTFDSGSLQVKVVSLPTDGSSSFSDSGSVNRKGLVDADRHLQVDVLSSALPSSASTETTLQTISFGGFKFTLRMETVGSVDYIGEAAIGTATSSSSWRIKKIDSTSGIVVSWAGTGVFDQVWDDYSSLTYS